jgi:hypothetical protein
MNRQIGLRSHWQVSRIREGTLSQKRCMISSLIMKCRKAVIVNDEVLTPFHSIRWRLFYISLLGMKSSIAFGTVHITVRKKIKLTYTVYLCLILKYLCLILKFPFNWCKNEKSYYWFFCLNATFLYMLFINDGAIYCSTSLAPLKMMRLPATQHYTAHYRTGNFGQNFKKNFPALILAIPAPLTAVTRTKQFDRENVK